MLALDIELTVEQGDWQHGTRPHSLEDTSLHKAGLRPLSVWLWGKVEEVKRKGCVWVKSSVK